MAPVITAAVTVTGLGDGREMLWRNLMRGQSAIRPLKRFQTGRYNAGIAACIDALAPSPEGSLFHSLLDRLFRLMAPVAPDTFLITATTKAGIDILERIKGGRPADLQAASLTALVAAARKRFKLTRGGINISAACASSTVAVARAAALIASGRADAVLVCCADVVTEFVFSGFSALKALSPVPCRPFDRDRAGLSLGDGGAALMVMHPEAARRKNQRPLGSIIGWGVSNDAAHITAPDRDGYGLVQAAARALKMAGKHPQEIAVVCAHGTGTLFNDRMEMAAFRRIFNTRRVPTYSIKGAIGHTLGAAGAIEVAVGLEALSARVAPPTVGLVAPMPAAVGWVKGEPVPFSGNCLLTTNSGFGGVNASLILEAATS